MAKNPKMDAKEVAKLLAEASQKTGLSEAEILAAVTKGDFSRLAGRISPKDKAQVAQMLQTPAMAALLKNNPKAAAFVQSFMKEGK